MGVTSGLCGIITLELEIAASVNTDTFERQTAPMAGIIIPGTPTQKRYFALLLVMAVVTFILLGIPNHAGSQNMAMVQMFELDEAAPLPYVLAMIAPAPSLNQALRNFIFYNYYYYGFPYFAVSALVLLPLKWLGLLNNIPLVMLALRQVVSIVPMLAALLLLVYMQDRFRTYRSPLLYAFLVSIPAVLGNNFWWHPDSLVFLISVIVIYCLQLDNLRLGRYYLLAAALCGIATATKLIGVYFFLAVVGILVTGFIIKKVSLRKLVLMALAYLLVMGVFFVAANPFLLSHWARTAYINIFNKQQEVLSLGYGILYEKGLAAAWPLMHQYYGEAIFIITALTAALWGLWHGPQRGLNALILAWFLPISVVILWITHFKYQYWLPAAIPLFSCLVIVLPEKWSFEPVKIRADLGRLVLLLIVTVQFVLYIKSDIPVFIERIQRAENNPAILFYDQVLTALQLLPADPLYVYYDYRLYISGKEGWRTETNYDLLNYDFIQTNNFDVLLLLQQRIRDYLNPNANGINPTDFAISQKFYRDAQAGAIQGYRLLYSDEEGLVFVRDDIYTEYFEPKK
jgi:hypothetical protein